MMETFTHKLVTHKKNILAFLLLLIGACILCSAGYLFLGENIARLIQAAGFLFLGYLHVLILAGNLSSLNKKEQLVYTLGVSFLIAVVLYAINFIKPPKTTTVEIAAIAAFVLPLIIKELWHSFGSMAVSKPELWYYSKDLPLQKSTTFLNSMPVRFKLLVNGTEEKVSFRAPVRMKLGLLFYHMVQEQNATNQVQLELNGKGMNSFGWLFYTRGFGGTLRYLNPEAGLLENKVKQNELLVARRVNKQETIFNDTKQLKATI